MSQQAQTKEQIQVALQPPRLWKVVFLNDDKTPMEFVIDILMTIFRHNQNSAEAVTLEIHNTGSGIAGVYPHEIAEQKGLDATQAARANNFPLRIQLEQE